MYQTKKEPRRQARLLKQHQQYNTYDWNDGLTDKERAKLAITTVVFGIVFFGGAAWLAWFNDFLMHMGL